MISPGTRLRRCFVFSALLGVVAAVILAAQFVGWPIGAGTAIGAQSTALDKDVSCTDCHREHQGHDFRLTAIEDSACQYCHVDIGEFTRGHPAFEDYPYDRRTRINFDHVGHERKHFPESEPEAVPGDCSDCHEPDAQGARMPIGGFEATCAACHAGEIRGEGVAGAAGIAIITVPGLDLIALREAGAAIGGWPELSDRDMTPFMRAVFAGDPELSAALQRFDELDPLDLRDAGAEDVAAVEAIAWAVKELFYDLIAEGPAALKPRLTAAFGLSEEDPAARGMLGGLTLATVREGQAEWFPNLFSDVRRHRAGQPVPIPESEFGAVSEPAAEETAAGSQESILGDDEAPSQESILGGDDGGSQESILGGDETPSQESILGDDEGGSQESILGDDEGGGQESILGDDEAPSQESILGDDDGGSQESILGDDEAPSQESILGGDEGGSQESILGDDTSEGGSLFDDAGDEGDEAEIEEAPPQPDPESWVQLGGWYRDYFALLYRPTDHADGFVRSWMDVAAGAMGGGAGTAAAPVLDRLTDVDTPGKCVKCHSVDRNEEGALAVNWRDRVGAAAKPAGSESAEARFVRFVHAPHLTLQSDSEGCADCHVYDREADYLAGFEDRDPATYVSNFQAIMLEECAECHVDAHAGNDCVQCHDYHVGHAVRRGITSLLKPSPEDGSIDGGQSESAN